MKPIDQLSFLVGLLTFDGGAKVFPQVPQTLLDVVQGSRAVDIGLAAAQQVEVGPIEHQDAFRRGRHRVRGFRSVWAR